MTRVKFFSNQTIVDVGSRCDDIDVAVKITYLNARCIVGTI